MTNQVNKEFGKAFEREHPQRRDHLVQVFEPLFKGEAAKEVERIAAYMGRNVQPVDQHGEPLPTADTTKRGGSR